jgi:PHD/YefM family antitoxin component YafN of YafNO toxin-antitoxin module
MTAALIAKARREAAKPAFGAAPILLTQRGKPKAYLLEARTFEAMQKRLSVLEGIALGEQDVREGRVVSHAEAGKRLARWLK